MTCSASDIKDYFFGELPAHQRAAFEQHLMACTGCREELSALTVTNTALRSIPDEEPPHRISFVSDKVFEPRWYQRFWSSSPQLGFASAALLAAAILSHGALTSRGSAGPVDPAVVQAAVREAVSQAEARQTTKLLDAVNERVAEGQQRTQSDILMIQEYLVRQQKQNAVQKHNAYYQELR